MDMDWATFQRAVAWAEYLNRDGAELSLTGIGEALLHPEFVKMLAYARARLPQNLLVFSTNGILLTDDLAREIAPYNPTVYISLHRPEMAGPALEAVKRHGLSHGVNASPATSAFDWAGQVKWHTSAPTIVCEYLKTGWAVVLVDGRITTCCLDASGAGVVGHIDQPFESLTKPNTGLKPYSLCATCHMTVP